MGNLPRLNSAFMASRGNAVGRGRVAPTQSVLRSPIERLCYILRVIDELIYDRPLNHIEAAMVTALLRAAREFRSLSPKSNYRTVYEISVNNLVVGSFKLKGSEVPINQS